VSGKTFGEIARSYCALVQCERLDDFDMSGSITFDELKNAPVSELPMKTIVDAHFDGTRCMHDFSREVMLPVLRMLLSPSPQEIAVRDTYYKMCLLLRSALVMNNLEHLEEATRVQANAHAVPLW
jgi:hypothetical protein